MEKIYLIMAATFFCSTVFLTIKDHLNTKQYDYLRNDYKNLEIRILEKQKRLRNYSLTALELNNICNKYPGARKDKAKNQKLQELLNELN